MAKLTEKMREMASKDPDTMAFFDAQSAGFVEKLTEEDFRLWAKQLGITEEMPEFDELKEIVEEIKKSKGKE